jgi:hypothetical protein
VVSTSQPAQHHHVRAYTFTYTILLTPFVINSYLKHMLKQTSGTCCCFSLPTHCHVQGLQVSQQEQLPATKQAKQAKQQQLMLHPCRPTRVTGVA